MRDWKREGDHGLMEFYLFICFLIYEGLVSLRESICQGCDSPGGSICRELGRLLLESFWRQDFC